MCIYIYTCMYIDTHIHEKIQYLKNQYVDKVKEFITIIE